MVERSTRLSLVPRAFDELVRGHQEELLRILTARLGSPQDAADIAQEAYARLLTYSGEYSSESLRRLLFRIASNLLTDHWRWRRYRETYVPLGEEHFGIPDEAPAQDRAVWSQQQVARVEAVIRAMPSKRRKVFVLSRFEGLTNIEVAHRCGISLKAVEKHITAALEACKSTLDVGSIPTHSSYRKP